MASRIFSLGSHTGGLVPRMLLRLNRGSKSTKAYEISVSCRRNFLTGLSRVALQIGYSQRQVGAFCLMRRLLNENIVPITEFMEFKHYLHIKDSTV